MNPNELVLRLRELGYRLEVEGQNLRYTYQGRGEPAPEARPLLARLKAQKPAVLLFLQEKRQAPLCLTCPWCQPNPWSHYPEYPCWCSWWWDYLLADNPQCRDRREGRVPDPEVKPPPKPKKKFVSLRAETTARTCYHCDHFQPAASSPNPSQAWGFCRHLAKGRYGVARACDAFVPGTSNP